jgi:hypothetical protein
VFWTLCKADVVRWWGIRHLRYLWYAYRLTLPRYQSPEVEEVQHLDAIWKGEA